MAGGRTAIGYGGGFGVGGRTRYAAESDPDSESRERMQQRLDQRLAYSPLGLVSTGVARILKHVSPI
jgi:hypothetical protein